MISAAAMKTWQAKAVAIAFIVLTLLGNFWVMLLALGQPIPAWFFHLLVAAVAVVLVGGASLLWRQFMEGELSDLAEMDQNAAEDVDQTRE